MTDLTEKEEKEIEEALDEANEQAQRTEPMDLPEAKASTTIRAYYKGFSVLFTRRNMEGKLEVSGVQEFIDSLVEKGFNPSWNTETNGKQKKATETFKCAKCGGPATYREGKTDKGKEWRGVFCNDKSCGQVKWL